MKAGEIQHFYCANKSPKNLAILNKRSSLSPIIQGPRLKLLDLVKWTTWLVFQHKKGMLVHNVAVGCLEKLLGSYQCKFS